MGYQRRVHGDSIPVSDPENISIMKVPLALFVVLACVLAVSEAQLNYFYKSRAAVNGALGFPRAYGGWGGYSGYRGYGGYYGGYRGYFRGKRSADAEPESEAEPEADADAQYYGYPSTYGYYGRYYPRTYGFGYNGYRYLGKRSADAEPEPQYYNNRYYSRGFYNYNNWGYYGRFPGYY